MAEAVNIAAVRRLEGIGGGNDGAVLGQLAAAIYATVHLEGDSIQGAELGRDSVVLGRHNGVLEDLLAVVGKPALEAFATCRRQRAVGVTQLVGPGYGIAAVFKGNRIGIVLDGGCTAVLGTYGEAVGPDGDLAAGVSARDGQFVGALLQRTEGRGFIQLPQVKPITLAAARDGKTRFAGGTFHLHSHRTDAFGAGDDTAQGEGGITIGEMVGDRAADGIGVIAAGVKQTGQGPIVGAAKLVQRPAGGLGTLVSQTHGVGSDSGGGLRCLRFGGHLLVHQLFRHDGDDLVDFLTGKFFDGANICIVSLRELVLLIRRQHGIFIAQKRIQLIYIIVKVLFGLFHRRNIRSYLFLCFTFKACRSQRQCFCGQQLIKTGLAITQRTLLVARCCGDHGGHTLITGQHVAAVLRDLLAGHRHGHILLGAHILQGIAAAGTAVDHPELVVVSGGGRQHRLAAGDSQALTSVRGSDGVFFTAVIGDLQLDGLVGRHKGRLAGVEPVGLLVVVDIKQGVLAFGNIRGRVDIAHHQRVRWLIDMETAVHRGLNAAAVDVEIRHGTTVHAVLLGGVGIHVIFFIFADGVQTAALGVNSGDQLRLTLVLEAAQ